MKETICAFFGMVGAAIASAFGGWSSGLTTLLVFMAVDYITGLLLAAVFKVSPKTESGALSSTACYKGLIKKGMMLLIVLIACRLDIMLGSTFIKDGTIIAFCLSELISIIENAGLIGIPVPKIITESIDMLKNRENR